MTEPSISELQEERDIEPQQSAGDDASQDEEQTEEATGPLIFISYRVHPDQHIAAALKELLETSLSPTPRVFVSGLGGLRPSSIGFKPQIQQAVRNAKAFIGIITPASKDREWIFFEAGAAFGRQAIYLPLLVDATTSDLPSTVVDYQACRAADREDVERALSSTASQIGCEMRQQFGKRFARFHKRLEGQKRTTEGIASKNPIRNALDAWLRGRTAEADAILEEQEAEYAGNPEELTRIKVFRLQVNPGLKTVDVLAAMNDFEPALRATAAFAYWRGSLEPRPSVAIAELRRATVLSSGDWMSVSTHEELLKRLQSTGHGKEAVELAVSKLRSPNRKMRQICAAFLCDLSEGIHPVARLLVAVASATAAPSSEVLSLADSAAESFGCNWLWWVLAEKADQEAGTGHSANQLGRALSSLQLHSLAYQAYGLAVEKGVSVAKVNQANLIHQQSVAAAAIALLDQHSGAFDAAVPQYPHETRMRLEAVMTEERRRANALRERGTQFFEMLGEFAERAIIENEESPNCTHIEIDSGLAKLLVSLTSTSTDELVAIPCLPLINVYIFQHNNTTYLMGFDKGNAPLVLAFAKDGDGSARWLSATSVDLPSTLAAAFGLPGAPAALE